MSPRCPPPLHHRTAHRQRRGLAAGLPLALAAALAWAAPEGTELMRDVAGSALDDPRTAVAQVHQRLAGAGAGDAAFWLRLALVEVLSHTDNEAGSRRELEAAARALPSGPSAQRHRLWLAFYKRYVDSGAVEPEVFRRQQAEAREQARSAGDEALLCRLDLYEAVVQVELDAVDEAWAALEAVDRCAQRLGDAGLQSYALGTMGPLAWRVGSQQPPQTYYERALQALGSQPARHKRAWLLDDLGWALLNGGQPAAARGPFEQVLALSTAIGDVSFMMRGHEGLAEVLLHQHDAEGALRHARAALRLAAANAGLRFREITAQTQVVEALALLQRPELAAEIDRLRAVAARDPSPRTAALIARSAARGYRALGQHALAYTELERYLKLSSSDVRSARERDAQRLQARYEATRRDAENRELRHAAELTRLELDARAERQRALWALVAALGAVLAGGGWFFTRALRRRRRLADLAMRDELTGLPNRRAVLAFAREQFKLARRLDLHISVALIDLDHFKAVNDRHGHAAGDLVLEAFARAAGQVVRGQDRIGRWGGEEWLLVMPGTRSGELPAVFERLRQALAQQRVPGLPHPHGVTFSMGAAERHAGIDTLDALIAEADRHLYQAKAQGRDALSSASMEPSPAAAEPVTTTA
ncbi:MAG: GGDEF domain-containing protein [Rubrivivax sp.]|nr:GGDEF domain-containing protein [Rubrivivax sp.]